LPLSTLDYLAAGGAAAAAGAVNALAGGGSLISFPTLVGLGVPAVSANVTNTVSLVPGYLGGSWTQRAELESYLSDSRLLAAVAAVGALAGSALLVSIPSHAFRVAVPFLILTACALLLFQAQLRALVVSRQLGQRRTAVAPLAVGVFLSSLYGGFFGAGLGIMLLAVLGLFRSDPLVRLNALKQALSAVVNVVAAVFFAFSGPVVWSLVPVMAVASVVGGVAGGRLVKRVDSDILRIAVVVIGAAVAVAFWAY
jgi:uncharacterized membrane protein YfcA